MQPELRLLTPELIPQIIAEAFELLMNPGIKVQLPEAVGVAGGGRCPGG